MNRTGKSNAKKGPDKDYNAFSDFTQHETDAHIIARWIAFAGMKDMGSMYVIYQTDIPYSTGTEKY